MATLTEEAQSLIDAETKKRKIEMIATGLKSIERHRAIITEIELRIKSVEEGTYKPEESNCKEDCGSRW
jgi:hypothetical protein